MIRMRLSLLNVSVHVFDRREQSDGAIFPPSIWAKVCPLCLQPWAVLDTSKPAQNPDDRCYSIHSVPCRQCMPTTPWYWVNNIAGSVIYNGSSQQTDWDLLEDLPAELVIREFKLHMYRITDMLTPEEHSKLDLYRMKINAGEMLPLEETREAIKLLRADRQNAAARASASKAKSSGGKSKAPARDANVLLGQLGIPGLGS